MAIISNLDIINQMKTIAASPVKKAASLILCRSSKSLNSFFDYQILMLERKVLIFLHLGYTQIVFFSISLPWGQI